MVITVKSSFILFLLQLLRTLQLYRSHGWHCGRISVSVKFPSCLACLMCAVVDPGKYPKSLGINFFLCWNMWCPDSVLVFSTSRNQTVFWVLAVNVSACFFVSLSYILICTICLCTLNMYSNTHTHIFTCKNPWRCVEPENRQKRHLCERAVTCWPSCPEATVWATFPPDCPNLFLWFYWR